MIASRNTYLFCFIYLLVGLTLLVLPKAVGAQADGSQQIRITQINVDRFPLIDVSVSGNNLTSELNKLPIRLEEDRLEKALLDNQMETVGIQAAIVVDASRNILALGNTGEERLAEVATAVNDFVALGLLSAETDWLMSVANGDQPNSYQIISTWDQDHQAVANGLIQFNPQNPPILTSLFGTIRFALEQFDRSPAPVHAQRSLVVFSDGADITSNVNADDLVRLALEADVQIHTVLLGVPGRDSRQNLGRLADLTNGVHVELNTLADLQPVWEAIAAKRLQQRLTYRLSKAQPTELKALVTLPDGQAISATKPFPVVGALPAEIEIVSLAGGKPGEAPLIRRADGPDTPLTELQPLFLPIQVKFQWPDGHARAFQRVEFSINNDIHTVDQPPFDQYDFPIETLGAGTYAIRVSAFDELGLSSTSPAISIQVQIEEPEGAGEGVGAGAVATPQGTTGDSPLTLWGQTFPASISIGPYTWPINPYTLGVTAITLSALMLLLALYFARRKKPTVPSIRAEPDFYRELVAAEHAAATEPSLSIFELDEVSTEPVRLLEFDAVAFLDLDTEGQHLPLRFALEEGQTVRIGRHSGYSDLIIEDTRVSRRHCTIEGRDDGFYLRDDGSAGGTYLNRKRLGVGDDRKLKHGDIINLNEIAYRFTEVDQDEHPTE